MTKRGALLMILPFWCIIIALSLMHLLLPDSVSSETENRTLQQFPTISGVFDGSFQELFQVYYAEQFPFRRQNLAIYTQVQMEAPQIYVQNKFISDDGWIIPKDYSLENQDMQDAAFAVNSLLKTASERGATLYFAMVPKKSYIFGYMLPYPELTLKEKTGYFSSLLEPEIKLINVADAMDALPEEKKEELFFKTDQHWNSRGALVAFLQIITEMITNGDLPENARLSHDDFYPIEYYREYNGDLNRNLSYIVEKEDRVPFMIYKGETDFKYRVYDNTTWKNVEEAEVFASGIDNAVVDYNQVYTYNLGRYTVSNQNSLTQKKLLVIKDSMQNPTSSMFPIVFAETEFVDVRASADTTAKEIINESDADIIMIFYNSSNIAGEMYEFGE